MPHVNEISRIELLKCKNEKIVFLFLVLLNILSNEIDLVIYNGMYFIQYTFGKAYMK